MAALVCGVSGWGRAYRAHLPIDNGYVVSGASLGLPDRTTPKSMPANDSAAS